MACVMCVPDAVGGDQGRDGEGGDGGEPHGVQ